MKEEPAAARITLAERLRDRARAMFRNAPRGPFWVFFLASLFFSFGFSIFFFLFNLYLLDFGYTERSLGILGGLSAAGGIAGTIPAGMLAERFGLRRTVFWGLFCCVVFSILRCCLAWQPAQMSLAFLMGLTLCFWGVCLSPAVAALTTEKQRPFAFSVMFSAGMGMGGVGGFVAGHLPGWIRRAASPGEAISAIQANRATLLIGCGLAALALLPVLRLPQRAAAPGVKLPRWSEPFLRRFLPAMAVWGLVTGAFPQFANIYFVHHLGLSLERMGSIFSVSQGVQFAALLCAPLLFRRAGVSAGIMLTQVATAAALGLLALARTPMQASWIYWAYMAAQYMNEPGIYSLLMDRVPASEHNGASASTFFVTSSAQVVASAVAGAALVRFGYPPVLTAIAALALMAAMLMRRLRGGDVTDSASQTTHTRSATAES